MKEGQEFGDFAKAFGGSKSENLLSSVANASTDEFADFSSAFTMSNFNGNYNIY